MLLRRRGDTIPNALLQVPSVARGIKAAAAAAAAGVEQVTGDAASSRHGVDTSDGDDEHGGAGDGAGGGAGAGAGAAASVVAVRHAARQARREWKKRWRNVADGRRAGTQNKRSRKF